MASPNTISLKHLYYKIILYFLACILSISTIHGQSREHKKMNNRLKLGLSYGQASQSKFPFNNSDYYYENKSLKIQINYFLLQKGKFKFEFNVEPSLYMSDYQLLNKFFIQPRHGDDYLEQRTRFTQKRTFEEYALNFGIITRHEVLKDLSIYFIASIGPMFSGSDTERLKKGFAFSDIFGFGFSYKRKMVLLDFRLSIRHNSNADLSSPNNGHNSIGIESGVSFLL